MDIEAPTFNSLNKPQRRALILRDHLRFTAPHHLDSLIDGITDYEPPSYIKKSGGIQPPLRLVTIKAEGARFDLGNVLFPEENDTVHRAYLLMENGRVEMHTAEALPQDEANLDSVAIHGFIAKTMVPMFKEKYQAVLARVNRINEARRAAHKLAAQVPRHFEDGKTLARLDPKTAARRAQRWQPGDPVPKHVSNMHKGTRLETIPDDVKSATFNTIPEQIKVHLFDNIVRTAMPDFDNLMMASWNVVSIYAACGSDFPELHKGIVDLKNVLQDFEVSFGVNVDRKSPKYRHDFADLSKNKEEARVSSPTCEPNHDEATKAPRLREEDNMDAQYLVGDDDIMVNNVSVREEISRHDMPPPRLPPQQPHEESSEDDDADDIVPPYNPHSDLRHRPFRQPSSRPEALEGGLRKPSTLSPVRQAPQAAPNRLKRLRERTSTPIHDPRDTLFARNTPTSRPSTPSAHRSPRITPPPKKAKKTLADLTIIELRQKYEDRRVALIKTFGSLKDVPERQASQLQQLESAVQTKQKEEEEEEEEEEEKKEKPAMAGAYLGASMLGAKKVGGTAPVANMLRGKKDGKGGRGEAKKLE
ncbi:hypothetical protein ACN47E_010191 [Coniothyrium glycines]